MANPAAEARAKAQEKWSGATVAERGRKHITHQHPSDPTRFMLDTHIGPIHYGAGEDQEIDTAWQTSSGAFDYEMTTNDWQTYARDTFNAGDIFRFESDGEWVEFDPQSLDWIDENNSQQQIAITQAITASVNDDTISFADAYASGIHFQYQNQTARLQKLITIDSFSAIDTTLPPGNTIWLAANFTIAHSSGVEVYLDGVLWEKANNVRVRTAGRIEFRDAATGQTVFWHLDYPRAWDSDDATADNDTIGQMEVRRQGGPSSLFITVRIPKTWIDSAVFPIYIDPTIEPRVGASTDDAWQVISDGSIDLTNGTVRVGEFYHGGMRWSAVTGPAQEDTIDAAYIEIYCTAANRDDPDVDIYFEDEDDPNTFTSTTNDITDRTKTTATVNWSTSGIDAGTEQTPELKTIVQEIVDREGWASGQAMASIWLDDGSGNRNLWFRSYDGSTSQAALLHIEYTAGAAEPSPNVSDDATATDSVTVDVSDPQASVSDDAEASESVDVDLQIDASAQDDATATDSATVSIEAVATLTIDNQDDATATDSATADVSDPAVSVSDSATATDSATANDRPPWYNTDTIVINTGSIKNNTIEDTWTDNGARLELAEESGAPGFDYEFWFQDVPATAASFEFNGYYSGNPGHAKKIQQWDYNAADWTDLTADLDDFPNDTSDYSAGFRIFNDADYNNAGEMRFRIVHSSGGINTHSLYIDQFILTTDPSIHINEDVTATDTTTVAVSAPDITVQDDATATDSVTVAIVDISDLTVLVQDDATATDSVTIVLPIGLSVQDDATATDTSTLDIALAIAAQDDATASDSATAAVETPATFLSVNISPGGNFVQIV